MCFIPQAKLSHILHSVGIYKSYKKKRRISRFYWHIFCNARWQSRSKLILLSVPHFPGPCPINFSRRRHILLMGDSRSGGEGCFQPSHYKQWALAVKRANFLPKSINSIMKNIKPALGGGKPSIIIIKHLK